MVTVWKIGQLRFEIKHEIRKEMLNKERTKKLDNFELARGRKVKIFHRNGVTSRDLESREPTEENQDNNWDNFITQFLRKETEATEETYPVHKKNLKQPISSHFKELQPLSYSKGATGQRCLTFQKNKLAPSQTESNGGTIDITEQGTSQSKMTFQAFINKTIQQITDVNFLIPLTLMKVNDESRIAHESAKTFLQTSKIISRK